MFIPTHGIMHHNTTIAFQRWIAVACMCCSMIGVGTATAAAPIDDALAAISKGNYAQAIKIFKPLAAQGNATAQTLLGAIYDVHEGATQDYQEALKWFRLAATQGDEYAQYRLGRMYSHGRGLPEDDQEALKWFRLAAAQGNVDAQIRLGFMYSSGGITQDYREAIKWFRFAAEQGNAEAQNRLGSMYYSGEGVTQDYPEALKWYRLAAEQGNAEAQTGLEWMYSHGLGVTQDNQEAKKWRDLAFAQLLPLDWVVPKDAPTHPLIDAAAKKLAAMKAQPQHSASSRTQTFDNAVAAYRNGDYAQAIKTFKPLAAQGDVRAQIALGGMYGSGKGITLDYQESLKWLGLAAAQGNAEAQNALGVMYGSGAGVTQDYKEALKWYRLSATQGNEEAKEALKKPEMVAVAQSFGTNWVYIGTDGNMAYSIYSDPTTIRKSGDKVKMWSLFDYKTVQEAAGVQFRSIKKQSEYDCKEEHSRSLYVIVHSENMGGGGVPVNGLNDPAKWLPVPPDSINAALWKIACKKR